MSTTDINIINVNGLDYPIKDQEARDIADSALEIFAYKEDGYTASQAYSVIGTPICWRGELYYTTAAIAQGALFVVGTNLRVGEKAGIVYASSIATLENELTANGNRIYMDYKDGKYGYNTSPNRGADTFFPFSGGESYFYYYPSSSPSSFSCPIDGKMYCICSTEAHNVSWYGVAESCSASAYVQVNGATVCNASVSGTQEDGRFISRTGFRAATVTVHAGDTIAVVASGTGASGWERQSYGTVGIVIVEE